MKKLFRNKKFIWAITVLVFFITLLFIEIGPYSSTELAKYNEGYGTFDMKEYNYKTVVQVMEVLEPEGYKIALGYYCGDYIFILFFGAVQLLVSSAVFVKVRDSGKIYNGLRKIAIVVPILRGVFDFIENTILVFSICAFPNLNKGFIEIASLATKGKLMCIKIWGIMVVIGIICSLVYFGLIRRGYNRKSDRV